MTETVNYSEIDGIAVLHMTAPGGNVLSAALCGALSAEVAKAQAAPHVRAVVLIGSERVFSVGNALGALTKNRAEQVSDLCDQIENASKPVIAALSGIALGAGFEVALACHHRIADERTRIGFPDVGLGILCGAGGTQRAPRLVGAEVTLQMMMTGAHMSVAASGAEGFFDNLVRGDLEASAVEFASQIAANSEPLQITGRRKDGFADAGAFDAALTRWRSKSSEKNRISGEDIVACVEASRLLPFEAGLAFEKDRFVARLSAPEFRALRHIALAEHRAAQFPEARGVKAPSVSQIGVIGIGAVGAGFAVDCLSAGFDVVVVDRNASALTEGVDRIRQLLDQEVADGRLSAVKRDGIEASLHPGNDLVAVAEADFVLEASGQVAEVERQVFAQLDGIVKEGAVLAAHGASADVAALARETDSPEDVIGLHFPKVVERSNGVEVVVGSETSSNAVAKTLAVLARLGKRPLRVAQEDGLVGHTVIAAGVRAAEHMVLRGADPYVVDAAMRSWGMALGPFELADRVGLDAPWFTASGASLSPALAQRMLKGRTSGGGWYRYVPGEAHPEATDLSEFLGAVRADAGKKERAFDAGEMQIRCLAAMANAGVGLLRKGVIATPGDVDVALVNGFGFPRHSGGPMMAAQNLGLVAVRATLRQMRREGDALSTPDPVFDHLIKNGSPLAQ